MVTTIARREVFSLDAGYFVILSVFRIVDDLVHA
jgi:hypothetical protein